MEKYVNPSSSSSSFDNPKPSIRSIWKRNITELSGRISSEQRHLGGHLLLRSYAEMGSFAHWNSDEEEICPTIARQFGNDVNQYLHRPLRRGGISGLEFDKKGIYLASVTKSGCLTVHDFETLYCLSDGQTSSRNEAKPLLHLMILTQPDVVRWNVSNQDEIACASLSSNEVLLYDIGYFSSEPIDVLKSRPVTIHHHEKYDGLSDVAFSSDSNSRLFASSISGVIYAWDRRLSNHPYLELTSSSRSALNSIQLVLEDRIIFGASKHGIIYAWDLRGGRTSIAFQSHKEVYNPPLASLKLSSMLEKITSLKAQSDILSRKIHSIILDPSCPYQLAFHLDDGWSGVLNTHTYQVTHIHCPPPSWLAGTDNSTNITTGLRRPAWLPTCSLYAVGSSYNNGIHLLDFYPDKTSPCHVDFNDEIGSIAKETNHKMHNAFIPSSNSVTACAAHPLNGTIIAGTENSDLLVMSQRHLSICDAETSRPGDKSNEQKEGAARDSTIVFLIPPLNSD